ncbi:hypothetical protein [Caballeronia insecticola]|uniref:Uncharacterized protein n=1 Tax=Caballeronia insecticola TaxID=758793 RepID=R4WLM4_9BURK|nr:hypothetical protein [Caballeronia insecticola]BAN25503.1 hypothetical protein BRPE64_BCDS08420 [Caballeronia insecticola]
MNPHSEATIQSTIGAYEHQDWLLDQALADTFPASDPIPPGSLV